MSRTTKAIVFACLLQGCFLRPSPPESPYEMSDAERAAFWSAFERRVEVWYHGTPPALPPAAEVWARTTWVLVPPGSLDPPTCSFSPGSFKIRVQTDVVGGCEAHELGHAALRMAGEACSSIYEHQWGAPAPARCLW